MSTAELLTVIASSLAVVIVAACDTSSSPASPADTSEDGGGDVGGPGPADAWTGMDPDVEDAETSVNTDATGTSPGDAGGQSVDSWSLDSTGSDALVSDATGLDGVTAHTDANDATAADITGGMDADPGVDAVPVSTTTPSSLSFAAAVGLRQDGEHRLHLVVSPPIPASRRVSDGYRLSLSSGGPIPLPESAP